MLEPHSVKLELKRKGFQTISLFYLILVLWIFSIKGPFYVHIKSFRIIWTGGFILGKFLIFQGVKFGFFNYAAEFESAQRRDNHQHTWKCFLMQPEVSTLFFLPLFNIESIIGGLFLVLVDVYACLSGKLWGKHEFLNKKTLEGSLGAFILIFLTYFLLFDISLLAILVISGIGVLFELFSKRIKVKDNMLLSLFGILFFGFFL